MTALATRTDEFRKALEPLCARVNARLESYLRQQGPDCPDGLRDAMAYSLLAGGKRMRPLLVLLACEACGGEIEPALPAACAIEMVHTYSLIHDDLPAMDDDDLRRGRPTCHVQFGEALAILAGDGLLTLAFEVIATDVKPPDVAAACCAELASAAGVVGMVGGQVADLEAERSLSKSAVSQHAFSREPTASAAPPPSGIQLLESIHRRKTGRLIAAALGLGARVAGADAHTIEALKSYGNRVGLAFQIADDLLDVTGDQRKMGKQVRKDADHGKLTYPVLLGERQSREKARSLIDEACRAIDPLGEGARRLKELAHFVLARDH